MKYSETGKFTPEMKRLAKEINDDIEKLRKLGCVVLGKQYELNAYLSKEYKHSTMDYGNHRIKYLYCGRIDDSGADDEEFFEEGYITED